ncbi:MAG TPA: hypothetical protein VG738_19555 [Chitinophagaceae bacterium]|nr:hypothetical protein [Chitinophagaceae bacterium]
MADGEGGYFRIYNATTYDLIKMTEFNGAAGEEKSNMDHWSLPDKIPVGTAAYIKIQFSHNSPQKDSPFTYYSFNDAINIRVCAQGKDDNIGNAIFYEWLWTPGGEPLSAPFYLCQINDQPTWNWVRKSMSLGFIWDKYDNTYKDSSGNKIYNGVSIKVLDISHWADNPAEAYSAISDYLNDDPAKVNEIAARVDFGQMKKDEASYSY